MDLKTIKMIYKIELFPNQPKEVLAVQDIVTKKDMPEPSLEYLKIYGDIISTGKRDKMTFELINDDTLHCDMQVDGKWETVMCIRTNE